MIKVIGAFIGNLIGRIIIRPIIHFWIGFLAGLFLELIASNLIISCFNIFSIYIEPSHIPYIFGLIALIGSFFYPSDYGIELEDEEE